jgi:hypothetical protein
MEIYEYIRKGDHYKINHETGERKLIKKGQKVGVLLATIDDKKLHERVGWSKCKISGEHADTFDRERGLTIARGRANTGNWDTINAEFFVPNSMSDKMQKFCRRIEKIRNTMQRNYEKQVRYGHEIPEGHVIHGMVSDENLEYT